VGQIANASEALAEMAEEIKADIEKFKVLGKRVFKKSPALNYSYPAGDPG